MAIGRGVIVAPDRTGKGTNALWRRPPDAIFPSYGPKSLLSHMSIAHGRGVSFAVMPNAKLALDIDRPADLEAAARTQVGAATRAALDALGYPALGRR